jgi:hypothetical protein
MIEVVTRLLPVGLGGLVTMKDLGGFDAEEADADVGSVRRNGREGVAVGDVRDGHDKGAGQGGGERRDTECEKREYGE